MTLHNAHDVFHPVITSAAIAVVTLVLLGVLLALAHLHTGPRDKAEEDA